MRVSSPLLSIYHYSWTSLNGIAPPLTCGRSSRTSTKFQGYQPKVETSDLTMHEVRNYFVRMSGLPWFDGTFKNYPAFERKWESYESIITV
jgi:hypothetical protein